MVAAGWWTLPFYNFIAANSLFCGTSFGGILSLNQFLTAGEVQKSLET
jgi:hypothetical protein